MFSSCCVCRTTDSTCMQVLSNEQRVMVFLKRGIFVSENSRCCSNHFCRRELTYEAVKLIERSHLDELTPNNVEVKKLFEDCQSVINRIKSFDFDDPTSLDDQSYKTITGLDRGIVLSFFFILCLRQWVYENIR